jgi:hypothetical protein
MFKHKLPQSIHRIFQAYDGPMRLRTPFTDYRLFDLFATIPADVRARVHRRWLLRKYPRSFKWIPNQRTGVPIWIPSALLQVERARRGALRLVARGAYRRIRPYQAEQLHWAQPHARARIEATILRPGSIAVDRFGRTLVKAAIDAFLDRGLGPVQVVGSLYAYEAYHRDLPAYLAGATPACGVSPAAPTRSEADRLT